MIALRLLRGFGIWNAGEVAGFPEPRAAELIRDGFAERLDPSPPAFVDVPLPPAVAPSSAAHRIGGRRPRAVTPEA